MKAKRLMHKVLAFVLCFALACGGFAVVANAAVDVTNIFSETVDDEIASSRWALSQSDSANVGLGAVGKPVFSAASQDGKIALQYDNALQFDPAVETQQKAIAMQYDEVVTMPAPTTQTVPGVKNFTVAPADGKIALQFDDAVTLASGEFVEMDMTLTNLKGTPTLWFGFGEKATDAAALKTALTQEGLELPLTGDKIAAWGPNSNAYGKLKSDITMHTQNTSARWRHPIGGGDNAANTAVETGLCLAIEGLGNPGLLGDSYENIIIKWRIAADGTATLSIGEKSRPANMLDIQLGFWHNGTAFINYTNGGFTPRSTGVPQVYIENASEAVVIESLTVTQYENASIVGGFHAGSKKSGGADYTETFASADSSKAKFLVGTATVNNTPDTTETVYAEQYVETSFTLKNVKNEPTLWFGFGEKAETDAALKTALAQEGVEFKLTNVKGTGLYNTGGVQVEITLHTQNTAGKWRNPDDGVTQNANEKIRLVYYNSNFTYGLTSYGTIVVKWQVHADGRAILRVGESESKLFDTHFGIIHNGAFVKLADGGLTPRNAGVPQVYIENVSEDVTVENYSVVEYDATGYAGGYYTGTKTTDGADYTETFASESGAKLKFLAGTPTFANGKASVAGKVVDTVVTRANQYIEYQATFSGLAGAPTLFFRLADAKATQLSDFEGNGKEGVTIKFLSATADLNLLSNQTGAIWRHPWTGASMPAGTAVNVGTLNGNNTLGVTATATRYSVRLRVYPDGTAVCSIKDNDLGWYNVMAVGWEHNNGWIARTGFTPVTSGYPQIVISGASKNVSITSFSAGVYNCGTISGDALDGTLVAGTGYTEEFASMEESDVKFLVGEAELAPAEKGIVINNAAENDYLMKKTKLSAPDDARAPVIYNISAELFLEALSGTGAATVYFAEDANLTNAVTLKFTLSGNTVMLSVNDGAPVETAAKLGDKFILQVLCGGNVGDMPYKNTVLVSEQEAGTFTLNTVGKFVAFGTTGISAGGGAAKYAVMSLNIRKHSYTAVDGGDFAETFDDNKYNATDVTISTEIIEPDPNTIMKIENGAVVCSEMAGYTTVISSTQTYGDFEWTFEISDFTQNDTGMVDFMFAWGRPSGNATYAAGGMSIMLRANALVCLDPNVTLTATSLGNFPTDKKDEDGNALGTTGNMADYNFSQGNLVFKVVKRGTEVKVYMWFADSGENDATRTTPRATLQGDYCGAGTVGICAVPTNSNMSLSVTSFAVKNLDEFQNENLIVGAESDRKVLEFITDTEVEVPPPPVFVTPGQTTETPEKKGCGCGSDVVSVGSVAAAVALLGAALLLIKRRKAENK